MKKPRESETFKKTGKGYFETEAEGLKRLAIASAGLLKVPAVYEAKNDEYLIIEKLPHLQSPERPTKRTIQTLARGLRKIHQFEQADDFTGCFGFPMDGQCGALAVPNNTERKLCNWVEFLTEFRFGYQLKILKEDDWQSQRIHELGSRVLKNLREFFDGKGFAVDNVRPSLLHGDLWNGNWGTIESGKVVCIYDPAPFYGHDEFDFGIGTMFGGPTSGKQFFGSYYLDGPPSPGFEERLKLYSLYNHFNHLNIFGAGYAADTLHLLQDVVKTLGP
jgi:fructosamine-3-kinase